MLHDDCCATCSGGSINKSDVASLPQLDYASTRYYGTGEELRAVRLSLLFFPFSASPEPELKAAYGMSSHESSRNKRKQEESALRDRGWEVSST